MKKLFKIALSVIVLSSLMCFLSTEGASAQGKPHKGKSEKVKKVKNVTKVKKVKKVKKHGPPPWAPAHGYRKNTRHIYFPVQQTYFDIDRGVYISLQGGKWENSTSRPLSLKGVDLKVAAKIELDFSGENPQSLFGEHKKKYPKNKK